MAKKSMDDLLKRRMSAAQQASELEVGNEAYETMFQAKADAAVPRFCELPINSLCPFRTADIGFHPYPPEKLRAFSQQLSEQGIYERIIVRPVPNSEQYEILAGHNRTRAWRLTGHQTIPAEVVEADDARAISIAVATNLLRRQDLTIIERGKAYKAMLDAQKCQGTRTDIRTSGENRQKFLTCEIVADFFGVTEYEIRKAIKLAALIPPLADILENSPRKLPIACAERIADYDADSQRAFVEMCTIEGYTLNKATMKKIVHICPPPSAECKSLYEAWRQARADEELRRAAPPKKITFDRRKFAPYLDKVGNDKEIESLRSWWSSSWYGKNAAGAVMPIRSILPVSHRSKIRTIPVRRLSRRMNRKYAVQEPRIWRVLLTGNPKQHAKNRRICCPRIVKIALQELQNPRSQNRRN
ncbi:MAG: ParB N-terminal domain-containing protein [Oscillospiraceae bacterium]|nr:ParB N-terminal domain-containing protein [Oscillospiraceae bacterium]